MKHKHAPGPWKWDSNYNGLSDANAQPVLSSDRYEGMWLAYVDGREANAAVIESAPELLAILKEAADFIQPFNRASELLDRIEAAILKAEGSEAKAALAVGVE